MPDTSPAAPPADPSADAPPPLWRELADGTAGPVVKAFVSVALAALAAGLALIASFGLAAWMTSLNGGRYEYVSPSDDVIGWLLVVAGLGWLAAVVWVWTRDRRAHRAIWGAALLTISVIAAALLCAVLAEDALVAQGEDVVIVGIVCLAASAVVLIWVQAARRQARPKALRDATDGALDVRCPACGYRMVGLHESRCPECGTGYTIDELIGRQAFITRAHRQAAPAAGEPVGGHGGAGSPVRSHD